MIAPAILFALVFGLAFGLPLALIQRRAVRRGPARTIQLTPRSLRSRS